MGIAARSQAFVVLGLRPTHARRAGYQRVRAALALALYIRGCHELEAIEV